MTTSPTGRERMSRVDTAWLRMDNDVNLMMIVGVWLLRPAISYDALCRRVEDKLLHYPRFRQRVVRDATGAYWCDDADFDIRHHVVREKLVATARPERARGAAGAHRRAGERGARSGAAALAVPPDRGLRRRQRAGRARASLHRRRHRPDLGDDDDHRRRQRSAAARRQGRAPTTRATGSPMSSSSRSAACRPRRRGWSKRRSSARSSCSPIRSTASPACCRARASAPR